MSKAKKPQAETSLTLLAVEPWPNPVSGAEVLACAVEVVERYLVLPDHAPLAVALWSLHTHAFDCSSISPRLAAISPEKQCGKTTLLSVVASLVPRPLHCANITAPAVFRTISKHRSTLLIDEADSFLPRSEELRGIFNSGHNRQSAHVVRLVGDQYEPKLFDTWAPVVIAAIKDIPDTLMDRSVVIRMRRRMPGETVERLRLDQLDHLVSVARKMARFVEDHRELIEKADPAMPDVLSDRAQDNWRPLLALAEVAGGDWPRLAREAAIALSGRHDEDEPSAAVQLLEDMHELMSERADERMSSAELVKALVALEDRPWAEWRRGQPMTASSMARLLKPFGIRPQKIRFGYQSLNGYTLVQIEEAVRRYGHPSPDPAGTPEQASDTNNLAYLRIGTDDGPEPGTGTPKSLTGKACSGVPGEERWEVEL